MKMIEPLVWLLPGSGVKNRLLRRFGHDISGSARIGPVLAFNVGRAVVGAGATIGALNLLRSLRLLEMGDGATLGSLNTVSAHPAYQALHPDAGCLIMGAGAILTSRHTVDCSGVVRIGDMAAVAGHRTTILSHEIDITANVQVAGQVVIGERSAVLTNCLVLKGAVLPPRSLLVADSMLIRVRELNPAPGIYGGSPAQFIRSNPTDDEGWFERRDSATTALRVDLPRGSKPTPNGNGRAFAPASSVAEQGLDRSQRRLGCEI
ncbi:acyltransferase [Mycobacterium sp. NPDC003449]